MCGIHVDGENHFLIAPRPGGHFSFAKAYYNSIYGRVESGWKKEEGRTVYTITVPPGCNAGIRLSGREEETVSSGTYEFYV